jgi:hypothetical protein
MLLLIGVPGFLPEQASSPGNSAGRRNKCSARATLEIPVALQANRFGL